LEEVGEAMTRGEKRVLAKIAEGNDGTQLTRAYFDQNPADRTIAKNLMWMGMIEQAGMFGDAIVLSPAGAYALNKMAGR
jgi:hypothetical protein